MQATKSLLIALGLTLATTSCIVVNSNDRSTRYAESNKKQAMSPTLGGKLFTSAWIQRSAEYQALCEQSYALATLRLDEALSRKGAKPLAIVTDIDETVLDNSPNSVHQALRGEDYTDKSWDEWCDRAEAIPLAGALKFFRYADSKGVKIFYISNRTERNRQGTLQNLRSYGFPQATDEQLMLRTTTSDKTERRQRVASGHEIVLLLGDNLGDFEHVFDSSSESERAEGVRAWRHEFGKRFIVLPNPNYGTWEKAMNGGYPSLEVKDSKLRSILKTY